MSVMTVKGAMNLSDLGFIAPHEHLFVDIRSQFSEFEEATRIVLSEQKVNINNLDVLSRNPYALKDNLVINDVDIAEQELIRFKESGGNTLVDLTPIDIGRDSRALRSLSTITGINIIAGCGYYTYDTHPQRIADNSIKDIADEFLRELTVGIGQSGIKAGIIGEIGTSEEIHPNEKKVLTAAAKAHNETGTPLVVHTFPWGRRGLEILELLSENKVNLTKVYLCHIDIDIDIEYCKKLASSGAYIGFDCFAKEYYINKENRAFAGGKFATDLERVRSIKKLIDLGFLSNILVSSDVCFKDMLHAYGGWGYDHILNNIISMMNEEGISKDQIDTLLKVNPKEFLDS